MDEQYLMEVILAKETESDFPKILNQLQPPASTINHNCICGHQFGNQYALDRPSNYFTIPVPNRHCGPSIANTR